MSDLLAGTTDGPWQVNGCRGKVVHLNSVLPYHGVGPDGTEVAAVWFDKETGLGWNDAKLIAAAPTLATENAALRSLCAELVDALEWAFPLADTYLGVVGLDRSRAGHHVGAYGLYDSERADRDNARAVLARSKEMLP